jgi:2-dehydropantoate 2-reductase
MRLLVVGAGATGGYFGGRLAQAGRDVTFLVRPARAEHLQAKGLEILSPHGNVTLKPQAITAPQIQGTFDIVLLTVKAFSLDAALQDIAPAVSPETMILPVLNGMKHIDVLAGRFGEKAVLGGVCKVAATLDEEGRILQLAKFQSLAYGERSHSISTRINALDSFMQNAGFDAKISPDIAQEMWEKWIFLAALGGITCLMRGTIGEIEAAQGGADFAHQFLDEVVSIAKIEGHSPSNVFLSEIRKSLTAKNSPQTSSMYRDLQKGYFVEADQIIGDLLERGRKASVATPLLAAAYAHLCVYQTRMSATK